MGDKIKNMFKPQITGMTIEEIYDMNVHDFLNYSRDTFDHLEFSEDVNIANDIKQVNSRSSEIK